MLNILKKKQKPSQDLVEHQEALNMFKAAVGLDEKTTIDPASTQPTAVATMYAAYCTVKVAQTKIHEHY